MTGLPKRIYLQWDPEGERPEDVDLVELDDVTWCQDKINDNDAEYILNGSKMTGK